jgi:hypothetical protein
MSNQYAVFGDNPVIIKVLETTGIVVPIANDEPTIYATPSTVPEAAAPLIGAVPVPYANFVKPAEFNPEPPAI